MAINPAYITNDVCGEGNVSHIEESITTTALLE